MGAVVRKSFHAGQVLCIGIKLVGDLTFHEAY